MTGNSEVRARIDGRTKKKAAAVVARLVPKEETIAATRRRRETPIPSDKPPPHHPSSNGTFISGCECFFENSQDPFTRRYLFMVNAGAPHGTISVRQSSTPLTLT
jgi:hypothetical protein